jgi:uroporphyrinogen-III synthase
VSIDTANVQTAVAAASSSTAGEAQILVLKKAISSQAQNAAALIEALPQMPALATSGSIGRNVNTVA